MTINLIPPRPARDQWPRRHGRPQITIPTGETLDCYSPSSLPNYLGLGFSGNPAWSERVLLKWAGLKPHVTAKAAPLDVKTDRDELNRLVLEVKENVAADHGTSRHSALRRIWRGETPDHTADDAPDIEAIQQAIADWGLELAWPDADETFMIAPQLPAAGEIDAVVTTNKQPGAYICDLKTGALKLVAHAIQMACYANAEWIADLDPDTGDITMLPVPEQICRETGLIIHAPYGHGRCDIIAIDLTEGLRLAERCIENHTLTLKDSRVRKPFGHLAPVPDEPAQQTLPTATPVADVTPIRSDLQRRASILRNRLQTLCDKTACTKRDVAETWPDNVPPLTPDNAHSAEQLDLIEGMAAILETTYYDQVDTKRAGIKQRLYHLPSDLHADVIRLADANELGNLETMTLTELERLDAFYLMKAETAAKHRLTLLVDALSGLPEDQADQIVQWVTEDSDEPVAAADAEGLAQLTAGEAEDVIAKANKYRP